MRAKLYALLLLLVTTLTTHGQGVIYMQDSATVSALVKTIGPRAITYVRADNADGPLYTVAVNKVNRIALAGGKEVTFAELHPHGIRPPHAPHRPTSPFQAMHARREAMRARRKKEPPLPELLQLKIAPSSLADPWGGMLPIAVEYNFGKHFGVEAMAAIPLYYFGVGYQFNDLKDVTVKQNLKFSISLIHYIHSWKEGHLYMAVEAIYRHELLSVGRGQVYTPSQGTYTYFSSADIDKTYYGGGIKFGITTRLAGNLWFDTNLGIGAISGTTWHHNVQGVIPGYGPSSAGFMGSDIGSGQNKIDYIEGRGGGFYIPFALRLIYHINR